MYLQSRYLNSIVDVDRPLQDGACYDSSLATDGKAVIYCHQKGTCWISLRKERLGLQQLNTHRQKHKLPFLINTNFFII